MIFGKFSGTIFRCICNNLNSNFRICINIYVLGKSTLLAHLILQSGQRGVERKFEKFIKDRPTLKEEHRHNTFVNNDFGHSTFTKHINTHYVSTNLHNLTFLDTPGCKRRLLSAYRICSQVKNNSFFFGSKSDFNKLFRSTRSFCCFPKR